MDTPRVCALCHRGERVESSHHAHHSKTWSPDLHPERKKGSRIGNSNSNAKVRRAGSYDPSLSLRRVSEHHQRRSQYRRKLLVRPQIRSMACQDSNPILAICRIKIVLTNTHKSYNITLEMNGHWRSRSIIPRGQPLQRTMQINTMRIIQFSASNITCSLLSRK